MPKGWLNLDATTDGDLFESDSAFAALKLSKTQRIYGFVGCLVAGFICSLLGTLLLFVGGLITFAVLYALGTIISLVGTGFLIGFASQIKGMFKPVRVVATLVLFATIGLIFVGAFVIGSSVLCIIFVVVEYLAYTWYTLSYIPYARSAVKGMLGMS